MIDESCNYTEIVSKMAMVQTGIGERLAWLAKRCGALTAAVVVRKPFDQVGALSAEPKFAEVIWRADSISIDNNATKCNGLQSKSASSHQLLWSQLLGEIGGGIAFLEMNFARATMENEIKLSLFKATPVFNLIVSYEILFSRFALSEQMSQELTDLSSEWRWETNSLGIITYASRKLNILGLDKEAFIKSANQVAAVDAWKASPIDVAPTMQDYLATQQPFRSIFHLVLDKRGVKLWMRSTGIPRFDIANNFLGYSGLSSDVTDIFERQSASDTAKERLDAILISLPDIVVELNVEGRYTNFISGPNNLFIVGPEKFIGRTIEDVLPVNLAARFRESLDFVINDGSCPPMRYEMQVPAGLRSFELRGARTTFVDKDDEPTALFLIRDRTNSAIREDEAFRLGQIVRAMSNMVAIVDCNQCIEWVNSAWEARTGWLFEEVRGRHLSTLVRSADSNQDVARCVSKAIHERQSFHGKILNVDRYEKKYWVDFNILPLQNTAGEFTGYVSVETDITTQIESEQRASNAAIDIERTQNRLKNAIESLPDGVVIWDENNLLIEVNTAYKKIYPQIAEELVHGVSQTEILAIGLDRCTFSDALGREKEWIEEQWLRYENSTIDEVRYPDGRWFRRLDLRTPDNGRISVRIDTTVAHERIEEIDKANSDLRETRHSLARILESADVGTWEWNALTGELAIGGNYLQMLGYKPGEFDSQTNDLFRSLVHPDDMLQLDNTEADDFAISLSETEPVREHLIRMQHKDGYWIWIMSRSAVAERMPDGRYSKVVGIHLNVSDRKRLEDDLLVKQRFISEVLDASIVAIIVVDFDGRITYANAVAEQILGLPIDDIQGRRYDDPVWNTTKPDGREMVSEDFPFRRALDTGGAVRNIRIAIEWTDSQRRVLQVDAVPHRDSGGASIVIMTFVDITSDTEKAESLEQALLMAHEASRAKSIFLANMSHEIRTPLNGVLGMAELLDGLITDPKKKEMIRIIRGSGEALLNVLNSVLDMSKIEAGKMVIETIPFVPADLIKNVEPLHRLRAEEKGIEIEVFSNPGAGKVRLGDPFRIEQILNNILSNAIKFTERGFVSLTMSTRDDKDLTIDVADTGIGMTSEQIARVFSSFEQAETGTTRRFGGTGLGMTIVRDLVNLMRGSMEVTSEEGKGTRVRITVPLGMPVDGALDAKKGFEVSATPSFKGKRIIFADDSETNRVVLQAMLQGTGVELIMATNGFEAVEKWKRLEEAGASVDLLLLDISMPLLDGKDALSAIRSLNSKGSQIPAIAVTANAMSHHVTEYIMAGFDAHVPKPFRKAELLHAISTLLF